MTVKVQFIRQECTLEANRPASWELRKTASRKSSRKHCARAPRRPGS